MIGCVGGITGEIQVLGTQIGAGLSDTGTYDATNLLSSTNAFASPDWQTSAIIGGQITPGTTAIDGGIADPFSGSNASSITETTQYGWPCRCQAVVYAPSTQYTFSAYLKQGLRTRVYLWTQDFGQANGAQCCFDLAGGQIGIAASTWGTFSGASPRITPAANGFYRCTLTFTTGSSPLQAEIGFIADEGAGKAASTFPYYGNPSAVAFYPFGPKLNRGPTAGAYGAYNTNFGSAAAVVSQPFSPNGGTTQFWGTQTANAWVGVDAGVPVTWTRYRFAPRPSLNPGTWPVNPGLDYATLIEGTVIETSASSSFSSSSAIDTIPSTPYYERYRLSERPLNGTGEFIRARPPSSSYGAISALQFFAEAGTSTQGAPVQPVISPMGGRYPGLSATINISSLTTSAKICYTVGVGSPPTDPTSASTLYTGPFSQPISAGIGNEVYIKAIAVQPGLSNPTSLVTTSAPFCGYGFTPKMSMYDQNGNLVEAHSGSIVWNPIRNSYIMVGMWMNATQQTIGYNGFATATCPGLHMYECTDGTLFNWHDLGMVIPPLSGCTMLSRIGLRYNAAYNNWVLWTNNISFSGESLAIMANNGPDCTTGWRVIANPFQSSWYDFSFFTDGDGVTTYIIYSASNNSINIDQLTTNYQNVVGTPLVLPSSNGRECPQMVKYSGTYFLVTGVLNSLSSTASYDLRYITSTGANPKASGWSAMPGTSIWAAGDPVSSNNACNGQPGFIFIPQGHTQPFIGLAWWSGQLYTGNLYNSRETWQPLTMTSSTMSITLNPNWNISQLG